MEKRLKLSSYLLVGSMLFGLFFGAGNLIFPVHLGQQAGASLLPAVIGFLITAIGLPFLGVAAIGLSESDGLFDLASRVHPFFGYAMTLLLYLTIGPFFALPRTATVSFEIGFIPYLPEEWHTVALAGFTILFFAAALFFSLSPGKILTWVGKILNPLFLIFLAFLIFIAITHPMGVAASAPVQAPYVEHPFFRGFTEGYNTMDVLASLAFAIIVVHALKDLGLERPKSIAIGTVKSGFISILIMGFIYASLAYIGACSMGQFAASENGGIALAQIARYYFGTWGSVFLAVIVLLACLKTAVGLITACAETFQNLFPSFMGYKTYAVLFTVLSCMIANIGLTEIISLSVPMLMFLYPFAIMLIVLALFSPLFGGRRCVYMFTAVFTLFDCVGDALNALPAAMQNNAGVQAILSFYKGTLPFFNIGMGWIFPMLAGFFLGLLYSKVVKPQNE